MSEPLWRPSSERIEATNLDRFRREAEARWGIELPDYDALWRWSIDKREQFWSSLWDFCGVIAETKGDVVAVDIEKMPGARYFPEARLNFAENLLRRRDDGTAMIFRAEDKVHRTLSWREIYDQVSCLAQAFRALGLKPGDRVGAYLPNIPETIVVMLAATSLGAVFSSCSPDFGVHGVLDRFGQIEPRIVVGADGYYYNGRSHDSLGKLREILAELPSVEKTVIVPYVTDAPSLDGLPNAVLLDEFTASYRPGEIEFTRLPFNDPLYILYSSGTTGAPKCIVHGIGGSLLQHLKEQRLHCDIKRDDRVFYFTTCGWMMWNWLAAVLSSEATILLYDGSPFYPDGNVLFDYADSDAMTMFGTSAKFIDAIAKAGLRPAETHKLASVRAMTSTGSTLVPEGFDYVYKHIKKDIHLASISGGTDLMGCFVLGNPMGPVWRGEIQARGLGMAVDVFDDNGKPVRGEKGELVCTRSFPSMPLEFWNDPGDKKYRAAYFERFPNIWCHGDYVELTEHDGLVIYGRSDAVLNPGGVRIGTAEIYRQVERLDEVVEGIVIGQEWQDDTRVVLFVVLREGLALDDALVDKIKKRIRAHASPRHVPACVIQVADIPRTKSGKIVELAVRDVVHGREVKNIEALANPEALELYRGLAALEA